MYCPDCGREAKNEERFCPACGYPLESLAQQLERENQDSMGWAERLVGRPSVETEPPPETPLISFKTGPEAPPKTGDEEEVRKCERCGAQAEIGALCPECGDRLPSLSESDLYLTVVLRSFLRITFSPRHFAINLPYPMKGGTLQPLLYPGVFAAFFVLTLPLGHPQAWLDAGDPMTVFTPALVGAPLYIFGVPILIYLTSGFIHLVAQLLGGRVPLRRAMRVLAAGIIWLLVLGIVLHLARFAFAVYLAHSVALPDDSTEAETFRALAPQLRALLAAQVIALLAWEYAWIVGGLYRLTWWKAALHLVSTFWIVGVIWVFFLLILPMRAAGLL